MHPIRFEYFSRPLNREFSLSYCFIKTRIPNKEKKIIVLIALWEYIKNSRTCATHWAQLQYFPTIWRPNCSICEKLVPRPQKSKFSKNEKKHPKIFTQGTSVPNFSQIQQFLKSPECRKVLASNNTKVIPNRCIFD